MKFHKKYIKALKEGKLAIELQPPTNEIHYLIKYINPKVSNILTTDKYLFNTNLDYMVSNHLPAGMIAKSVKEFIKPSIENLTENDVVVCDSEKQYNKFYHIIPDELDIKFIIELGSVKNVKQDYPNKNIIPYRDLFPEKKKSTKARIAECEKQLKQLNISMFAYGIIKVMEDAQEIHKRAQPKYKQGGNTQAIIGDNKPESILTPKAETIQAAIRKGFESIKKPKTDAIDWNKPGQIFISDDGIIVMLVADESETQFSGVVLNNTSYFNNGEFNQFWIKDCFKPCTEDITIKINE